MKNISYGFCNVNVRMWSSGKKMLKSVKQYIFSRFHTLKPISISLSNAVGCAPSSTFSPAVARTAEVTRMISLTNGCTNKWKICIWVNSCRPRHQLKNLVKQCLRQNVQYLWLPYAILLKLKNNLHWSKDLVPDLRLGS